MPPKRTPRRKADPSAEKEDSEPNKRAKPSSSAPVSATEAASVDIKSDGDDSRFPTADEAYVSAVLFPTADEAYAAAEKKRNLLKLESYGPRMVKGVGQAITDAAENKLGKIVLRFVEVEYGHDVGDVVETGSPGALHVFCATGEMVRDVYGYVERAIDEANKRSDRKFFIEREICSTLCTISWYSGDDE